MKKSAILVLLTLSSCLSQPTDQKAGIVPSSDKTLTPETKPKEVVPPPPPAHKEEALPITTTTTEASTKIGEKAKETIQNSTEQAGANATKPSDNNTTDRKQEKNLSTESSPTAKIETKTNVPTEASAKNETKPENKTKDDVTTQKSEVTTKAPATTVAPKNDSKETPPLQARGFDGPSFIGGIILTLGLLAIGFMGFKYYKNQTERNYHTL